MTLRAIRAFLLLPASFLIVSCGSTYPWVSATSHDSATDAENLASLGKNPEKAKAFFPEAGFEFGQVLSGTLVEHDFIVRNTGFSPLLIERVSMTTPLLATRMPREIGPGAEGRIHFKLDTTNLAGQFEGAIVVFLNNTALLQANLTFTGHITPSIELSPMPSFFVAGQKGRGGRAAIEIVNHESEPLQIEKIEHRTDRFTTQLETLKQGQQYRLNLSLRPDGPLGRSADTILVSTSSKRVPVLKVGANTYLYERVHTFPELVALGTLRATDVGGTGLTLMIYQEGGKDFQLKLSTDIPGLNLKWVRGPKGDRYQAKITLIAWKIPLGPIKGSIFVDTNDPQFPRLIVPVQGQIAQP
ncbi:MAG TPA: DUF1573 domain-containing protein [Candidatus Acidoferrum sp.]|nr:DUF1573 domain-containing protein [Candidatus Acidoferrum sp.]